VTGDQIPYAVEAVETRRDARGWVSNLLDFLPLPPSEIRNVHIVEMRPGAVAGNHRHRRQTEWLVVCGGPVLLSLEVEGRRDDRILPGDTPTMVTLPPGVAHAVRFEGAGRAHLVAVTDSVYDFANPDSEPVHLLAPEDRHEA